MTDKTCDNFHLKGMLQLSHGGKVAQRNTFFDYYTGCVFLPVFVVINIFSKT